MYIYVNSVFSWTALQAALVNAGPLAIGSSDWAARRRRNIWAHSKLNIAYITPKELILQSS
jgi:hypothetical protein